MDANPALPLFWWLQQSKQHACVNPSPLPSLPDPLSRYPFPCPPQKVPLSPTCFDQLLCPFPVHSVGPLDIPRIALPRSNRCHNSARIPDGARDGLRLLQVILDHLDEALLLGGQQIKRARQVQGVLCLFRVAHPGADLEAQGAQLPEWMQKWSC